MSPALSTRHPVGVELANPKFALLPLREYQNKETDKDSGDFSFPFRDLKKNKPRNISIGEAEWRTLEEKKKVTDELRLENKEGHDHLCSSPHPVGSMKK